ncbi:hypothetical protein PPTG_00369 [Phytophthora nicotianae INRA-310]|uniref:Chromo domain-containing protein n=1 Tax=Phytophthora nicotianae (strain INRA-310) TaxID=761204 RepID=W2RES6_PHYN3|nr:hypothetical protein PPTG_00369 [Phytophthora nicotianae INRA-310]ETN23867.1 hypothetical protein PPTG_00369 [Phytophthora nicotianae INRA-310]
MFYKYSGSPGELFTALPRPTPFEPVVVERNGVATALPKAAPPPAELTEELQKDMSDMHKDVEDICERRRLQNMARSNGTPCSFTIGDFVLWSRIDSRFSVNKLLARWVGPFEVVEEHPHAYMIRHLITGQRYMVHESRLKFYCDASLGASEEMKAHVGNQGMVLGVEELKAHRKGQHGWQLLVSWVGLQEEESSWEALQSLYDDLPARVRAYVTSSEDHALMKAFSEVDQSFRA